MRWLGARQRRGAGDAPALVATADRVGRTRSETLNRMQQAHRDGIRPSHAVSLSGQFPRPRLLTIRSSDPDLPMLASQPYRLALESAP